MKPDFRRPTAKPAGTRAPDPWPARVLAGRSTSAQLKAAPTPDTDAKAATTPAGAGGGGQDLLLLGSVLVGMLALSGLWAWLCVFVWKLDGDPNGRRGYPGTAPPPPGARASHGEQL